MIGKREFDTIAKLNADALTKTEAERHIEEATGGLNALLNLIASQVAAFQLLNPAFDARQFVKASGVKEDWLQSRILGWAAQR